MYQFSGCWCHRWHQAHPASTTLSFQYCQYRNNLIELNPNLDPIVMNSYSHTCHFERMLENLAFRNDIIDNASRMRGFVATLKKKEEMLGNLHVELDRKLGITHKDSTL